MYTVYALQFIVVKIPKVVALATSSVLDNQLVTNRWCAYFIPTVNADGGFVGDDLFDKLTQWSGTKLSEQKSNDNHAPSVPWNYSEQYSHVTEVGIFFFFPVPVCAITASGVPGGTFVSMNRFSTLCVWLAQRQGWRVKGWLWPSEQAKSARANSRLNYQMGDRKW
jgi:hypothetical protein